MVAHQALTGVEQAVDLLLYFLARARPAKTVAAVFGGEWAEYGAGKVVMETAGFYARGLKG